MKKNFRSGALTLSVLALIILFNFCGCGGGGGGAGGGSYGGGGSNGIGENAGSIISPVVTSVTNAQGTSELIIGEEAIISGSGFGSLRENNQGFVSFMSGTRGSSVGVSTYLSWSENEIRITVPDLSPGQSYLVVVSIVTSSGSSSSSTTSSSSNTITAVAPQPVITSMSPSTVNQGAGTPITILGSYLGNSGVVNLGSTLASAISWSSTSIKVNTPVTLAIGTLQVTVTPTGAQSSNSQTLNIVSPSAPTLQNINPSSVSQGVAASVTLTGTNFGSLQGAGAVNFGTTQQLTVTSWTSSQIICEAPASLADGTHAVSVLTNTGEASNSLPFAVVGSGKIYALFVGINQYAYLNDLQYCVNDINGMKNNMNVTGGSLWSNATSITLTDSQATKSAIQNALNTLVTQVTAKDTFYFQYSGHGSNSGGHAYIVPTDSNGSAASCIQDDELNGWLSAVNGSAKKVIIFDSCYSGGFIGKAPLPIGVSSRFVELSGSSHFFAGRGFERLLDTMNNLVFLAACKKSELSWESSSLAQGLFTYYLMEGLGAGSLFGPAASGDSVSAEGDFTYAAPKTSTAAASLPGSPVQTPQLQDNYVSGSVDIKK